MKPFEWGNLPILSRDRNLSRKPPKTMGKWQSVFERTMAEKNGESTPRTMWGAFGGSDRTFHFWPSGL